jgi:antitoxin ParD1/3/4
MNVSLTPELEQLVIEKVRSGMYLSASEVVREALRLLQERDSLRELQRARLAQMPGARQEQTDRAALLPEQAFLGEEVGGPAATAPGGAAETVRCRRTVPIGDDAAFGELAEQIDRLMARWGFTRRQHKGSVSWIVQPGTPLANRPLWKELLNETLWKLCHYGPGDMAFGVRRELVRRVAVKGQTLAERRWPLKFGVPPQPHAVFLGFPVHNEGASVGQVEDVLNALGAPDPAGQVPAQG